VGSELLLVGIGGVAGSVSRYLVYVWFNAKEWNQFPWATLLINVAGCLLIGIIGGMIERSVPYHRSLYLMGSVGFLGAFTTFSAFGLETLSLIRVQGLVPAMLNILANVIIGLAAVWLGRTISLMINV
jgi:fluoride exporter